ncbi:MAG: HAD hydrolase family protein [Bacteroidetes bacterium]|nr:HAD hydrolase family protein [Bacteroidota bacterium]
MKILFSDIDGTLTNKFSHAFEDSGFYLDKLIKGGFTVVLASSKTFEEICFLQNQLGFSEMFIFENGSGIAFPLHKYANFESIATCFREVNLLFAPWRR